MKISSKKSTLLGFILSSVLLSYQANSQTIERLFNQESYQPFDVPSKEEVEKARKALDGRFSDPSLVSLTVDNEDILEQYDHLDPDGIIPRNLLEKAIVYFDKNKRSLKNKDYLTVVDFDMSSKYARMFIVDMDDGSVWPVHTAHGEGGDKDHDGYVEQLSNITNSHMSSRGFYYVNEIYYGKYGRSIRLDGLSSTNSRVRSRAIVVHGSDYVWESNVIQGRSWGCFALAWSVKDDVVDLIAGGSLLYAERSGDNL